MQLPAGGTELPDIQARNFVLACYAVSLTTGETLLAKKIRHATLRNYIKDACILHERRKLASPRAAPIDYVDIILKAVKKYEIVPNRREMIHDNMYHELTRLYKQACKSSPDSQVAALCDWLFLGRHTGFRKSEWCHDSSTTWATITDPEWGDRPNSVALILQDITFQTADGTVVTIPHSMARKLRPGELPLGIRYMRIRIRKQKNNNNYEVITYEASIRNTTLCPVRAGLSIVARGMRLGLPEDHPAAVFRTGDGRTHLIRAKEANSIIRQTARQAFHLKHNDTTLNKWSTHSIRVTACNLLHRAGFNDAYIKNRLRWRSDTFQMYLRNTFYNAEGHAKALDLELAPTVAQRRAPEDHELLKEQMSAAAA